MILNDKDALRRLNSPLNLINQLRNSSNNGRKNAMSLFIPSKKEVKKEEAREEVKISFNPFLNKDTVNIKLEEVILPNTKMILPLEPPKITIQEPAKLDNILENHESQIKLGLAHDRALDLLNRSVEMLSSKLDDVKADKLSSVIGAASKTVDAIRRERSEASRNNREHEVHYHFYTPQQRKVEDYEVIDVTS